MTRLSPKIEIINHFEKLIKRVDIDIDDYLQKYNDDKVLEELLKSSENNRKNFQSNHFNVKFFDTFNTSKHQNQTLDLWTESTKVIDYLKQVRMKTTDELRKAQEETLEYYKLNSSQFKDELLEEKNLDELKSELFAEKFYFQIHFKQSEKRCWTFTIFTFVTDFYISPSDIDSLEKLINAEKEPFGRDYVFNHKTILIGLLYKHFIENLLNFPNHVINAYKRDVLNIESINFNHEYSEVNITSSSTIDLSKLVDLYIHNGNCIDRRESVNINIEGLSSLGELHIGANSTEIYFSIRSLSSLTSISLYNSTIDQNIIKQLLEQVQHIQYLILRGTFSNFNLDGLTNLKLLSLGGTINEDFNFELFKNLCNHLVYLKIKLTNIDDKQFFQLFSRYSFSHLLSFVIIGCNLKILKKEYISRFPILTNLFMIDCKLEVIEHKAFSNVKSLRFLDLSQNRIKFIEKKTFSMLKNLEILDLSGNELTDLDAKFIGVRKSAQFLLENKKMATFNDYWYYTGPIPRDSNLE